MYGQASDDPDPPAGETNLSVGKTMTASSTIYTFVAPNANDGNVATYWEAAANSYPNTLAVALGANATVSFRGAEAQPDRPGRAEPRPSRSSEIQNTTAYTSLVPAKPYPFRPGHREHGHDPGQRGPSPTFSADHQQLRSQRRPGRRVPGDRGASPQPRLDRHRVFLDATDSCGKRFRHGRRHRQELGLPRPPPPPVSTSPWVPRRSAPAAVGALAAGAATTVSVPIGRGTPGPTTRCHRRPGEHRDRAQRRETTLLRARPPW